MGPAIVHLDFLIGNNAWRCRGWGLFGWGWLAFACGGCLVGGDLGGGRVGAVVTGLFDGQFSKRRLFAVSKCCSKFAHILSALP